MAARTIAATDTIETLRTTFNALSEDDFGDIGTLDGSLSATSVIGAVNEIFGIVSAASGFTITDGSTSQVIGNGETLTFTGTSNEIEAVVSSDTLTIGLPDTVAITTSLTVGGVAVPTISSTSTLTNKTLTSPVISTISNTGTLTLPTSTDTLVGRATTDTLTNKTLTQPTITQPSISAPTITSDMTLGASVSLKFEGSTDNDFETTLTVVDPTADRTITLPNAAGTVVVSAGTSATQSELDLAISAAGQITGSAEGLATSDSPTFAGMNLTGNLDLGDSNYILLGASDDLQIYHDGSNSYIYDSGTGNMIFRSDDAHVFTNAGENETKARFVTNGTAELYYDNSLKIATTTNGIHIQNGGLGVGTDAGATDGEVRATGDITAFYSSDIALKENIHNIPSASDKIEQLNGVLFDWKQDFIDSKGGEDGYFMRKTDVGVIAQDVEKVLPEIVGTRSDGIKAVKYDRLVALLIEGFKELKKEINDLKSYK